MNLMASFAAFLSDILGGKLQNKNPVLFVSYLSASDNWVVGFGFWVLGPRSLVFGLLSLFCRHLGLSIRHCVSRDSVFPC